MGLGFSDEQQKEWFGKPGTSGRAELVLKDIHLVYLQNDEHDYAMVVDVEGEIFTRDFDDVTRIFTQRYLHQVPNQSDQYSFIAEPTDDLYSVQTELFDLML